MYLNILKFGVPVILLVAWLSVFTVDEREKAILLKFGEITGSDFTPGIHLKIPLINKVIKFDRRILTIDQNLSVF